MENSKTNVVRTTISYSDGSAPKVTIQNPAEIFTELLFIEKKSCIKRETTILTKDGNHVNITITEDGIVVVINGEKVL